MNPLGKQALLESRKPYYDEGSGCYRLPLADGRTAIIDEEDVAAVSLHPWFWGHGEVGTRLHDKHLPLKRFIAKSKARVVVIHANDDKLDFRRSNLKCATRANVLTRQKKRRQSKNGETTSRFKGVAWERARERWRAQIKPRPTRKVINLGRFRNEREAAEAYDKAAIRYFGEHAWLNFPRP